MKSVLFVLPALPVGGIETYIIRLAATLKKASCDVDVLIISNKYDHKMLSELKLHANVIFHNRVPFKNGASWFNAFLPMRKNTKALFNKCYDMIHAVDLLTLAFVNVNSQLFISKQVTMGVYHSKELTCWKNSKFYFAKKLNALLEHNVNNLIHANELSVEIVKNTFPKAKILQPIIVPIGIDLSRYSNVKPNIDSNKIISVGRLVNFKTYNEYMIRSLVKVREYREFEYYIYGTGPDQERLVQIAKDCNVSQYVHFMGNMDYADFPDILNNAFCFVGSGTAIIEASAAGIPSFVGIESIEEPLTCGWFSELTGYSYNEKEATDSRVYYYDLIKQLISLDSSCFYHLSNEHRKKSNAFDILFSPFLLLDSKNENNLNKHSTPNLFSLPMLISIILCTVFERKSFTQRYHSS